MEQKFKKGDIVEHVLGEKLLIVDILKDYDGIEEGTGNFLTTFKGRYECKRSNFNSVPVHESELKEMVRY